jgi:hypothetical protein
MTQTADTQEEHADGVEEPASGSELRSTPTQIQGWVPVQVQMAHEATVEIHFQRMSDLHHYDLREKDRRYT